MNTAEIITIQCGNYANFVGSHYWNFQELGFEYDNKKVTEGGGRHLKEVDNDILYREGHTLDKQVTYTPRLVSIDLKGSLGGLPELGDLYEKPAVPKPSLVSWSGETQLLKAEPFRRNDFLRSLAADEDIPLADDDEKDCDESSDKCGSSTTSQDQGALSYDLDNSVQFWSDYLYARFHPKSIMLVEDYQAGNELHPFDVFGQGEAVWSDSLQGFGDEVEDRIRFFAEECENLQGFQLITDSHNGFGGISHRVNQLLSDEYGGKCVLSVPVSPPVLPTSLPYTFPNIGTRLAGHCLSLSSLVSSSSRSLCCPMSLATDWFLLKGKSRSFPHLDYNAQLDYHTSAVLGSVLDVITLPYRQKQSRSMRLYDVISGMALSSTNMAAISTAFPLDLSGGADVWEDGLSSQLVPLVPAIGNTPNSFALDTPSIRSFNSLLSIRGALKSAVFKNRSQKFSTVSSPEEYLDLSFRSQVPHCQSSHTVFTTKPSPTIQPFPHIFGKKVGPYGMLTSEDRDEKTTVKFASSLAVLDNGSTVGKSMANLSSLGAKLKLSKLPRVLECGTEEDDWKEHVEQLTQVAELYNGL